MKKDLGTYWLRVEFDDGRGYLEKWETGRRYVGGSINWKRLDAKAIEPSWENEQELFETMEYQYVEGNYACDCNKLLFLARANQQDEPEHIPCGDTLMLFRLTAIRPDGSEQTLWEKSDDEPHQFPVHEQDPAHGPGQSDEVKIPASPGE
jgi:hypothetical protein